jgi:molybdenum cofactor biosynthesis protein B
VAVLTVSDTRTLDTDTSGAFLVDALVEAGHTVSDRQLVIDDIYQLRATVSQWIADPAIEVVPGDRWHRVFGSRLHAGSAQPPV